MKKLLLLFLLSIVIFSTPAYSAGDISVKYNDGIYHIVLKGEKIKKRIKFVSNDSLITNKEAHQRAKARLTINAGYFDPNNERSVSYIVTDRNTTEDPIMNTDLFTSAIVRRNLDKILNRTEFRIVECYGGKTRLHYEIVPHKSEIEFGCNIITSAQAGPLVYPQLRLEEEFFVVRGEDGEVVRESCSVLHKTARTVIGLKDGVAHILIITDDHPMDLYEVHDYVKSLGWDRAMTFDGGSSTSMNYLNKYNVVSTKGDGAGRSLKSFMIIR